MQASPEPETFEEAVSRFETFLRQNDYPPKLVWVEPTDVLVSTQGALYVKLPVPPENLARARERFERGMSNGLGVLLGTICYLPNATCCYAWIPMNHEEQLRRLMADGLKLSVVTDSRRRGKSVRSRLHWYLLRRRHRLESPLKLELFR